VDQAFSQSLRQASAETRELKGEALALQQRVAELQRTVKEDQAKIAALTAKGGFAADGTTESAGDDLSVAKAQLGLDQSELSDSKDLARESGDQRVKIQQELSSREAAMKKYDAQAAGGEAQTAVTAAEQYNTLAGQLSEWWAQRSRKQLIEQAEQLARADVAALTEDRVRLEAEAAADEKNAAMVKSGQTSPERINQLQRLATQRNILSILNDRLGAQQQLVALYVKWGKQVELQHKIVLHRMLQSLTSIAIIFLLTLLAGWACRLHWAGCGVTIGRSGPCERF
jgi:hypothetical protein